jgi:hypothetical protein
LPIVKAKRFSELSLSGKLWASILIAVSLVLVIAAERDIQHRSADEVTGSKLMWRVACLNALGALTYFRWGRRTLSGDTGRSGA